MAFELKYINQSTLVSTQSTIVLNSIPGTYDNLLLVLSGRTTRTSATVEGIECRFNADTSDNTNYTPSIKSYAQTTSNGSAANNNGIVLYATTDLLGGGIFGASSIVIPNYSKSTLYKTGIGRGVTDGFSGTPSYYFIGSGTWANAAAITTITLVPEMGTTSFKSGTVVTLYGF